MHWGVWSDNAWQLRFCPAPALNGYRTFHSSGPDLSVSLVAPRRCQAFLQSTTVKGCGMETMNSVPTISLLHPFNIFSFWESRTSVRHALALLLLSRGNVCCASSLLERKLAQSSLPVLLCCTKSLRTLVWTWHIAQYATSKTTSKCHQPRKLRVIHLYPQRAQLFVCWKIAFQLTLEI